MTVREARVQYGNSDRDGYVSCPQCPVSYRGCPLEKNGTGYADCWQEIVRLCDSAQENETVNHPAHYQGKHECIDEMIALFGVEAVKHFCMCNVYKYRFRAANKNGQEDISKAEWYMDKLMELEAKDD